jgi:hypothetical protein
VRQWAPLAAVVVLLGAAMLATLYANPQITLAPPFLSGVDTAGPEQTGPPVSVSASTFNAGPQGDSLPFWVTYAVSGFCLVAVLVGLGSVAWFALRQRIGRAGRRRTAQLGEAPPTLEDTRSNVRGILDAGLAELDDTDQDPRRAIIACWLRLERAATVAGVEREAADTSTDLADRLVSLGLVVRVDALAGLAELYRQARYAPHDVDQTMRQRARAALVEVRAELSRWPGVRPVGSPR